MRVYRQHAHHDSCTAPSQRQHSTSMRAAVARRTHEHSSHPRLHTHTHTHTHALTRAHWRHLASTIELVLPSAHQSPQPKQQIDRFTGSAIFAQLKGRVSSGTLAPPGEYDWTCASLGTPESTTQMANGSVQPFLHSSQQNVPILYNGRPFPAKLSLPIRDLDSHRIYDSLGQREPITQTASLSVQLFLHRWPQSVLTLYNGPFLPPSKSKLLLPTGDLDCHLIHGSLGPSKSSTKMASRSVQSFLQGSLMWQTDRPTEHTTRSVTTGRIYICRTAMRPKNGWTDQVAVLFVNSGGPKEAYVTWGCTLAPPGECH